MVVPDVSWGKKEGPESITLMRLYLDTQVLN